MKKYWYWIELIGFDVNDIEKSIDVFVRRTGGMEGVSLLLFSVDFVNDFKPGEDDELPPSVCSYAAHNTNGERCRQVWTKGTLKRLVEGFKARGIKVLMCVFNMYLYHIDGKELSEGFSAEHLEINEWDNRGKVFQVVSMIKRFKDGRDYGDYFIEKLLQAVDYYDFDGVQIADGISSARLSVEWADYSDDLVSRFVEEGGILPEGVSVSVGADEKAFAERASRIFKEIRPAWTKFLASRWTRFLRRLTAALKGAGKFTLVNTAWTREPSEAYIRYAMDYASAFDRNVDALMVEENAQTMAGGGVMHYGGAKASLKRRARLAYEGYVMQLAIKALKPEIPQITMCPVRDNEEQFDTLRCGYTEITKSSALRNMAVCFDGEKYLPVSENLLYTLSDSVTESEWRDLHLIEEKFGISDVNAGNGVLAVFSKNNPVKEAERYFSRRALTASESYVRCIVGGLPISGSCEVSSLPACKRAVIVANAELYDERELQILEDYRYPLFLVGYRNPLRKTPCVRYWVNGEDGFGVYGFNLETEEEKDFALSYPAPNPKKKEKGQGMFTSPLDYEKIPERFFREVGTRVVRLLCLPKLKRGTGCKCFPTQSGEKTLCVITNDSYYYEFPEIQVEGKILEAHARAKLTEYRVPKTENTFRVLVNNRGADVIELILEEKK